MPPILSEADLRAALEELERLWGALPVSPEEERFDELAARIEAYEALRYLIHPPHSDEEG
jgi:antitoxin component HigA of HigAB toxin-antitoxin module